MKVLAIDPGQRCGFASSSGPHGVWDIAAHHPGGPPAMLITEIERLFAEHPFDVIYTEGSYPISRRGADRLEWLRGAVFIAAYRLGPIPVKVIAPSSLKLYWAGSGRAEKPEMIRACIDRVGIVPQDGNEADAIAMLHLARCNQPAAKIERQKKKTGKGRRIVVAGELPF